MSTVKLTAGALSMLYNQEQQAMDLKPVVQVTDVRIFRMRIGSRGEDNYDYRITISDGSYCMEGSLNSDLNKLITSHKLQKGSIVQLTGFVCSWLGHVMAITIKDVNVVLDKCNIIGDPKPMSEQSDKLLHAEKAHANKQKTKETSSPSQARSKKQKRESSNPNKFVVAEENVCDNSRILRMEKNKEDDCDVDACIEKLEKLGWRTQDPLLYDTALLLFGESGVCRKLWMHLLMPESCEKWVRNAGSKYGLLG